MWWRRKTPRRDAGASAVAAEVQAAPAAASAAPLAAFAEDYDASGAAAPPDIAEDRLDEAPRTRPAAGENASTRSEQFDAEEVWRALAEARRQALAVYARYKLPLTTALYQRRGDRHAWRPAEEAMTAEQRWAFVLDGAEAGWRLVGLDRVGRIGRARVIEVQMAAGILALTEALRRRLPELDAGARADIGRAFELGRLTAAAETRAELVRRRKRRRDRLRAARAKAQGAGTTPGGGG
jgi:hypothetical protein